MSRGFVKESDQEPEPFVPPRAVLPEGATNYVTPRGMRLLHGEREMLEGRRADLGDATEDEARRALGVITKQLMALNARIASAREVASADVTAGEVRFGTTVRYRQVSPKRGKAQAVTIVGVDEANFREGRISYLSPLARALVGKKVGEEAEMGVGGEVRRFVVEEVGAAEA